MMVIFKNISRGRLIKIALVLFTTIIIAGLIASEVFAVDIWSVITGNADLKPCYANNAKILKNHSIGSDVLRIIIWGITSLLAYVAHLCGGIYDTAFGFIDWTTNPTVSNYVNSFRPILVALMALSLLYLGIVLIISHEKKPNIMVNIMIAVLCVTCSATLFDQLNSWTIILKDAAVGAIDGKEVDQAYATVGTNMVDLVEVDKANSNGLLGMNYANRTGIKRLDTLDETGFNKIDFAEVLNSKSSRHSFKSDTKRVLSHRLITDSSGDVIVELNNGFGWNSSDDADIGNEFYYRYYLDWLPAWMEEVALMVIYITMSYKCVRVIFELIFGRLLAYLYSAELSGGEKIKKILVFIRDSYILLIVTALCIKIYFIMNALLAGVTSLGGFTKGLFCLFLAFSVIDGPNLVEKLLGMDAGLRSSTARWMALGRVASGVAGGFTAKGLAQKAQDIKSGDMAKGGLAAGAVGAIAGKEVANGDSGTHREGGIASVMNAAGSASGSSGAGSSGGVSGGGGVATVKGEKGDKGDRGIPGRDGKDGSDQGASQGESRSFMDSGSGADAYARSSSGPGHSGDHSFMNTDRGGSAYSSGSSAMPKREISSNSSLLDKKGDK